MEQYKHLTYLIKLIADRQDTLFTQKAGPIPVTAPQGRLLLYLESRGGEPVSQRELEHYLGVSHTTVKGLLQRLEEKKLVRTAFDSADGRVKHAYLTEEFHRLHNGIADCIDRFEAEVFRHFSEADCAALRVLLERLYADLLP